MFFQVNMKKTVAITTPSKSLIFKSFFLSLSIVLLFFLSIQRHRNHQIITYPPPTAPSSSGDLRIRPGYTSYSAYIQHQLHKTLNPRLRKIWTTRDWDRKIDVFSNFFQDLKRKKLLRNNSKALCIGARMGQEVAALKRVGVLDAVGIDLVPSPPLVMEGDFHSQPFENQTFDFEFSNVFDHALYPWKFVGEIERTLRPGGVCVLHVALTRRGDKYSANDLYSVGPLMAMFRESELVHIREVDGFGLDTELVFRKKKESAVMIKIKE
ncbi:PREDICTED: uncharacterized protein LOC104591979 [Nelumbo nucifera]|uniref:Methyltransferase type 11 domain-containing protein n=2 Tax=Nelumbo nucifera TaxID=4432 RepID=A0A822YDR6_NELNU|nr:PREDICTED: uncharacterized protein LOC104591979 [Nelumbo nucifera]DAD30710.1 TPA_asm: hypothetical protein HUJ06_009561 [Nelumbo nucifera]